jgi:hypothetical protein
LTASTLFEFSTLALLGDTKAMIIKNESISRELRQTQKLLTTNTKLDKQNGEQYLIVGLSLAPHRRSGTNLCPDAGFCSAVCNLWFSGLTRMPSVQEAMLKRSRWLLENRESFESKLCWELLQHERKADRLGLVPLVRLNVASDLDWSHIVDMFPGITFYDYTKVLSRIGKTPSNYHLTYSVNERSDWRTVNRILSRGFNVSMVFDTEYCPQHGRIGELPTDIKLGTKWWSVIDGDKHDIRIPDKDGFGNVVGLRFKGSRKLLQQAIEHGFVFPG